MENRNYRGINKSRTVIASRQKSVNIEQRVIALKSYTEYQEESQISSSSSSSSVSSSPSSSSQKASVQHPRPDSTVVDPDQESDKRKIFSCEYEGCNKKYTKLSHLKVKELSVITFLGLLSGETTRNLDLIICSICNCWKYKQGWIIYKTDRMKWKTSNSLS